MADKYSQSDLFNFSKSPSEGTEVSDLHVYILTNRNNLLDMLSTGQIRPSSFYKKYYPDLGQFCPNAIPLLLQPPSSEFISASVTQDENIFPVILELILRNISGDATLISNEWLISPVKLPAHLQGLSLIISGVLPVSLIDVVHFRTHAELKDYQMRKYSNVPEDRIPLQISKDIFDGISVDTEQFQKSLQLANEKLILTNPWIPPRMDALAGATLLLGRLLELDQQIPLSVMIAVLEIIRSLPESLTNVAAITDFPSAYQWLVNLRMVMIDDSDEGSLAKNFYSQMKSPEDTANLLLSAYSIRLLSRLDSNDYSSETFLHELEQEFAKEIESANESHLMAVLDEYLQAFALMNNVIIGTELFESFSDKYSSGYFLSLRAILLFVLRKDPKNLLSAINDRPRHDPSALLMATIFSGLLHGRSLIPSDSYPDRRLRNLIDTLIINSENMSLGGLIDFIPQSDLKVVSPETGKPGEEILFMGNEVILKRVIVPDLVQADSEASSGLVNVQKDKSKPPRLPGKKTETVKSKVPVKKPSMPLTGKISISSKPISMEALKQYLLSANINSASQPEYLIALELCRIAGWDDLVRTVFPLEGKEFALEYRRGKTEFRLIGFVTPYEDLFRIEDFKKRFASLKTNELEQYKTDRLQKMISDLDLPSPDEEEYDYPADM